MQSCLICDDHAMMREALASAVALHWPDTQITLAADFTEARTAITASPTLSLCAI